jgi:hypothetical protein
LDSMGNVFRKHIEAMEVELERYRRMIAGTGDVLADLVESINARFETQPLLPLPVDARE